MRKKVLIFGVSGLAGHTLFAELSRRPGLEVWGSAPDEEALREWFPSALSRRLLGGILAQDFDAVTRVFETVKPQVVINAVRLTKIRVDEKNPLPAIAVNVLFPHRLHQLCEASGTRLIHLSTDCVFSGRTGNYSEKDLPDAEDLYGRTESLGEVTGSGAMTLRVSCIGHELHEPHGLLEWFMAQKGSVKGFKKAIYSGLPTVEFARVIADYILPRYRLRGLYHLSSEPISKYELLRLVAAQYGKRIKIIPDEKVKIDRSLDSARLRRATGYRPPSWEKLVKAMHQNYCRAPYYRRREKNAA